MSDVYTGPSASEIAYAVQCDKAAGLDMDQIQTNYLLSEGAKMLCIALMGVVAAVLISLIAARVGAGVGKNLRGKVFKNVVGFSNKEMDQFYTFYVRFCPVSLRWSGYGGRQRSEKHTNRWYRVDEYI